MVSLSIHEQSGRRVGLFCHLQFALRPESSSCFPPSTKGSRLRFDEEAPRISVPKDLLVARRMAYHRRHDFARRRTAGSRAQETDHRHADETCVT